MSNNGRYIVNSQNAESHIDELLAQKKIYSNAKTIQSILLTITVPLPIVVAIVLEYWPSFVDQKSSLFVLYFILASLSEKIMEGRIGRLKKLAASIQEKFDTGVLRIRRNKTLNTAAVDPETIRSYSKKIRKNQKCVEKVMNWYSTKVERIGTNIATVLCQRTNIYYDFSVRKRYNWLVGTFVVITFLTLLIIALQNELELKSFLIEAIIPAIPIFLFAYNEINSNIESIDNLEHLKYLIEESISGLTINGEIDESLLRSIQDRIYMNRILSPLIPDVIYDKLRPRLEDEMNYSIEQKIESMTSS